MNNFKKIGLTALAASLVSTSVFAGELTATGSASVTAEGWSGTQTNTERALSMADSVTFGGSTELDNGMTVSMSFEVDGDDSGFDDRSFTVSSDTIGTFKFSGHGGSTAASAIDGTAAGDMWDNFDGAAALGTGGSVTGVAVSAAEGGDNSIFYTLPSLVDGLGVTAAYRPAGSTTTAAHNASATSYAVSYTGVEGLSVSYGVADKETGTATTSGDQTVMKASYVYGPVTASWSNSDYDIGSTANNNADQETTSWALSYTLTDAISLTYGQETIDTGNVTAGSKADAEFTGVSGAYTAGGMTVTVKMQDAENIDHSTDSHADGEYWSLALAFAF
jgi:outer membrane protein OmpU